MSGDVEIEVHVRICGATAREIVQRGFARTARVQGAPAKAEAPMAPHGGELPLYPLGLGAVCPTCRAPQGYPCAAGVFLPGDDYEEAAEYHADRVRADPDFRRIVEFVTGWGCCSPDGRADYLADNLLRDPEVVRALVRAGGLRQAFVLVWPDSASIPLDVRERFSTDLVPEPEPAGIAASCVAVASISGLLPVQLRETAP